MYKINKILKSNKNYKWIKGYNYRYNISAKKLTEHLNLKYYQRKENNIFHSMFADFKNLYLNKNSYMRILKNKIKSGMNSSAGCRIHAIECGGGDSFLIENKGEYALIDFGYKKNAVKNYLDNNIISNKIKYAFITHLHKDHLEDLRIVSKEYNIENLVILNNLSDQDFLNIEKNSRYLNKCDFNNIHFLDYEDIKNKNIVFPLGDAKFSILGPSYIYNKNINNNSIVLNMLYKNSAVLFTGDIESQAESKLKIIMAKKHIDTNNIKVLKVAHHGSRTSSSPELINSFTNLKYLMLSADSTTIRRNVNKIEYLKKQGEMLSVLGNNAIKLNIDKDNEFSVEYDKPLSKEKDDPYKTMKEKSKDIPLYMLNSNNEQNPYNSL